MDYFHYRNGELFCEDVPVAELAAEYGTPLWVYSQATLLHQFRAIQRRVRRRRPGDLLLGEGELAISAS